MSKSNKLAQVIQIFLVIKIFQHYWVGICSVSEYRVCLVVLPVHNITRRNMCWNNPTGGTERTA